MTERINVKEVVVSLLRKTKVNKVATVYPSSWTVFPTAIYQTTSQPHQVDSSGRELQTKWTITIELYGKNNLADIEEDILTVFRDVGFFGTAKDANTADLKRKIIEISAIVDNVTKYVFKK